MIYNTIFNGCLLEFLEVKLTIEILTMRGQHLFATHERMFF